MRSKKVSKKIERIGKELVEEFKNKKVPKLEVPSRYTSNIIFDPEYQCYVLGDKTKTRSVTNIRQIKKVSQLLKVAKYSDKELIKEDKHSTLRELYYFSENWGQDIKFDNQQRSNDMIEDLEAMLGVPREHLRIIPEEKGSVYGDILVKYKDPRGNIRETNCLDSPEGMAVGPKLDESEFLEVNAKNVIAVESGGMYSRLIEEGAFDEFSSILVHLGGQSSRSIRFLLKRLHDEHNLPIYLFVDADPWGMHIASVIIFGSANAAHINKRLAVPEAKWIGLTPSDIQEYELRSDKLNKRDVKRLKELLDDPRYQEEYWQKELKLMLKTNKKAEQQSLARHGLSFVVDKYLPAKFEKLES